MSLCDLLCTLQTVLHDTSLLNGTGIEAWLYITIPSFLGFMQFVLFIYTVKCGLTFFLCSLCKCFIQLHVHLLYFVMNRLAILSCFNCCKVRGFHLEEYALKIDSVPKWVGYKCDRYVWRLQGHPQRVMSHLQIAICCHPCLFSFPYHSYDRILCTFCILAFPVLCSLCPDWSPGHLPWTLLVTYVYNLPHL